MILPPLVFPALAYRAHSEVTKSIKFVESIGALIKHGTKLVRPARDKHCSLLQKFVNYGQNFFITLAPGPHIDYNFILLNNPNCNNQISVVAVWLIYKVSVYSKLVHLYPTMNKRN